MGLFHNLRRGCLLVVWGAAAGLAFLAWQQRERFTPIADFYTALTLTDGYRQQIIDERRAEVVKVVDPLTVTVRDESGRLANVRLTGIDGLPPGTRDTKEAAAASATLLGDLVLSNRVSIQVTHQYDPTALLGLVWVGTTNVNVALVRAGVAHAKRSFMNGLPLRLRYDLLRAQRAAESRRELPTAMGPDEAR